MIFDHCSLTGECDEEIDIILTGDFTMQWCTVEETPL